METLQKKKGVGEMKKCPKCKNDMEIEDGRYDTEKGVSGSIIYFCEVCDYQEEKDD